MKVQTADKPQKIEALVPGKDQKNLGSMAEMGQKVPDVQPPKIYGPKVSSFFLVCVKKQRILELKKLTFGTLGFVYFCLIQGYAGSDAAVLLDIADAMLG